MEIKKTFFLKFFILKSFSTIINPQFVCTNASLIHSSRITTSIAFCGLDNNNYNDINVLMVSMIKMKT